MLIPALFTDRIDASLEQWTDAREISADDLSDLLLFILHGKAILVNSGHKLDGFQVRQRNGQQLLTVKVHEGDTPLVAFITAATTTGCVRRLLSLWESDRMPWVRDRYPWI